MERAGFEIAWQVEIDKFCQRVLAKHWPNVPRYGDIKSIDWGTLPAVDLMCGGFPCQPFSLAGQRRGTADDRYLWPAMLSGIQQLQPTWIIGENVPGLVGPVLDTVLSDLETAGYEVGTLAVPACAFDTPHIRQRIWIVAHCTQHGCASQGGSRAGCSRESEQAFQALADTNGARELQQEGIDEAQRGWSRDGSEDVADSERGRRQAGTERSGRPAGTDVSRRSAGTDVEAARRLQARWGSECREEEGGRAFGESSGSSRWPVEPELGRVAHGIPNRVDRLRGLGNAIVPQIAEWLGRQIMKAQA